MGRKIDLGTSMNSGSKGTGRWKQQRGSSAQQSMCPAGGCPGVPPCTCLQTHNSHSSSSLQPRAEAWAALGAHSGRGEEDEGMWEAGQPWGRGAAKAVSRDAAGLRSLGSAQERSCL